MATIKQDGQTYLEQEGIELRRVQTARDDYSQANEYSEQHQDALSTGDEKGKGTGNFGGHGWIVPDMTKPKSEMSGMFNTEAGGNSCDEASRSVMTARSLYGPDRQYGVDIVPDTSRNRLEGQYDGAEPIKVPYICPVA
jgi:hypothetical protein